MSKCQDVGGQGLVLIIKNKAQLKDTEPCLYIEDENI